MVYHYEKPVSFRPVSNLSFASKIAENAVISQLLNHCNEYAPLPTNQSSYRQFHSTETALTKVQSDILSTMDRQEVTLLVLLDLSAAFDIVHHETIAPYLRVTLVRLIKLFCGLNHFCPVQNSAS